MASHSCFNCGMGYQDCACYVNQHHAKKNDYEDAMLDALDERSGANKRERDRIALKQIADVICQTNELLEIKTWS